VSRSRRALLVAVIAAGAVGGGAESARADEPLAPATQDTYWYGWQNVLVDAGEVSLVIVAAMRHQPALGWVGGVSSVLGSGLVHAAHGNFDGALGSAGGRGLVIGWALLGGALVDVLRGCDPNENAYALGQCRDRGELISYGVAVGLAALTDDILVARARRTGAWPAMFPFGSAVRPPGGGPPGYTFGISGVF
jgi:hypothetical protein